MSVGRTIILECDLQLYFMVTMDTLSLSFLVSVGFDGPMGTNDEIPGTTSVGLGVPDNTGIDVSRTTDVRRGVLVEIYATEDEPGLAGVSVPDSDDTVDDGPGITCGDRTRNTRDVHVCVVMVTFSIIDIMKGLSLFINNS